MVLLLLRVGNATSVRFIHLHSNMVLLLRVYKQLLISLVLIPVFCLSFEFYNIYKIYSNINYFKLPLINDYNYNCLTYCILAL